MFSEFVKDNVLKYDEGLEFHLSEMASIREIKAYYLLDGVVEFQEGIAMRIINPASAVNDSWFTAELKERFGAL